ncbi:MAG TPA: hypothetical protein VKT82_21640 [Ktedonobacterales bacterium]|nr:hypothetical protein [Ktedonobacterales bacterium]
MTEEKHYILKDAAELLDVSKGTLVQWIARAGLSEIVESQVDAIDLRARYLTEKQLEYLAAMHNRMLKSHPDYLKEVYERIERVEQAVQRLTELMEQQVAPKKNIYGDSAPPSAVDAVQRTWIEWQRMTQHLSSDERRVVFDRMSRWVEEHATEDQ